MKSSKEKHTEALLIFVLYDGINNSVFDGQVLQPLVQKITHNPKQKIVIISFEKQTIPQTLIKNKVNNQKNLELIICRRLPFFGRLSLLPAIYQLRKILRKQNCYQLVARGPIAGWICKKTLHFKKCQSFYILARGLLAAEYRYTYFKETNIIKKLCHRFRAKQLESIEKGVYVNEDISNYFNRFALSFFEGSQYPKTIIEVISPAMKTHLVSYFGAKKEHIEITTCDIPTKFSASQIASWKNETRKELGIPKSATVYCYNGSAKPWQCPEKIVLFFKQKFEHANNSFLIVLTQDKQIFHQLITKEDIPPSHFTIKKVNHTDVYKYLSACNYGLLFREKNIVNWVSRPTKVLEYLSVGLNILHNDTVDWVNHLEK